MNVRDLVSILSKQTKEIEDRTVDVKFANVAVSTSRALLSAVRLEWEYQKSRGLTPDIPFLNPE